MSPPETGASGVLVLAPRGRDAEVIASLLRRARTQSAVCASLPHLVRRLDDGVGAVVLTEESLIGDSLPALLAWVEGQPPWSDMPFLALATRQAGPRPPAWAATLSRLGNVVLLERPLNAETLHSAVRSALRARARQEQVRRHVAERDADARALRASDERLRELNEQLEQRVAAALAERQAALARLAQAQRMQALGQLAGGIAHDINNVLQAVTGGAQLIAARAHDPAGVTKLARKVGEAAERGSSVARRMLAFARQDELRAEPVDASAVLANLAEILTHTMGGAIAVQVETEGSLPRVLADKGQLDTVLINLAANARDAMPQGGALVLSAEPCVIEAGGDAAGPAPGRYVRLSVADDGAGMDADTLARASEPFFTTKPVGKGTGLGLAMARGFAEQSGGTLTIESAPGRGTRVALLLPQADSASAVAAEAEAPSHAACRVMLVDDDPLVREMLAATLEEQGFDVVAHAAGQDALDVLDQGGTPDIVISDLSMPGMDGLTFVREAQRRRPDLPAILLTGYAGEGSAGDDPGCEPRRPSAPGAAFELLHKPIQAATLGARVVKSLDDARARRAGAPAAVRTGN